MKIKLASERNDPGYIVEVDSFSQFQASVEQIFNSDIAVNLCLKCYLQIDDRFGFEWSLIPGVWLSQQYTRTFLQKVWQQARDYERCVSEIASLIDMRVVAESMGGNNSAGASILQFTARSMRNTD